MNYFRCVGLLMICFGTIDKDTFLTDFWQKKPLLIRQALPNFVNPFSADELAGLALEEGIESRMVFETPNVPPFWQLKTGPFTEADFAHLPKTHWTLLVQGVDRWVPEIMHCLTHFDFIPQWRVDDVMVSFAVEHGSVGPHYDHYDVFLYQAEGRRQWSLTTKQCNKANYIAGVDLRIMAQFDVEETYLLEQGDMLYLPPHVGHHGVSVSNDCMTYSFGYRSYHGQELWDSFGDFLAEEKIETGLYRDPNWASLQATSAIPFSALDNAKQLMQQMLQNETQLKRWFGCFATRIDGQAEQDIPQPLEDEAVETLVVFVANLNNGMILERTPTCRMAYYDDDSQLFVNGCEWPCDGVSFDLVRYVANSRLLDAGTLRSFLSTKDNQLFLYELWRLQWLVMVSV